MYTWLSLKRERKLLWWSFPGCFSFIFLLGTQKSAKILLQMSCYWIFENDLFTLDTFLLSCYYNSLPIELTHTQGWCITHFPLDRIFSLVTFTSSSIFKIITNSSHNNIFKIQGESQTDLTLMKTLMIIFPGISILQLNTRYSGFCRKSLFFLSPSKDKVVSWHIFENIH